MCKTFLGIYCSNLFQKANNFYSLQNNGETETHIRERMQKTTIAIKRTWSIRKRIIKENYKKRIKIIASLVGSVAFFETEVWEWLNKNRLNRTKRKYVKWVLNLVRKTPNYILLKETKITKLRMLAIKRAINYKEKVCKIKVEIVKKSIRDLKKKQSKKEESRWEKKRRKLLK